jgi:hypothetical protein
MVLEGMAYALTKISIDICSMSCIFCLLQAVRSSGFRTRGAFGNLRSESRETTKNSKFAFSERNAFWLFPVTLIAVRKYFDGLRNICKFSMLENGSLLF